MFSILSQRRLAQIKRDERHTGITLGYQLAQSHKQSFYGCQGIQIERQPQSSRLLHEIDSILKGKGF